MVDCQLLIVILVMAHLSVHLQRRVWAVTIRHLPNRDHRHGSVTTLKYASTSGEPGSVQLTPLCCREEDAHRLRLDRPQPELMAAAADVAIISGSAEGICWPHPGGPAEPGFRHETVAFLAP